MNNFKYEVIKEYGTISNNNGYELKLRFVSWNGRDPKYDLRTWSHDAEGNERCGKGITLSDEQLKSLTNLLNEIGG